MSKPRDSATETILIPLCGMKREKCVDVDLFLNQLQCSPSGDAGAWQTLSGASGQTHA